MAMLHRAQAPSAASRLSSRHQRVTTPRFTLVRSASASAPPAVAAPTSSGMEDKKVSPVVSITGDDYASFLEANELVLVDYYTDWCGPCKMIAPHLEEMAVEMPNVKFAKLNCTTDPAAKKIAMGQGIKALPTFHLFKNNERVGVFVGGKPAALRKFLTEQLSS